MLGEEGEVSAEAVFMAAKVEDETNNFSQLTALLDGTKNSEIDGLVERSITSAKAFSAELISTIYLGSPSHTKAGSRRRSSVFMAVLRCLSSSNVNLPEKLTAEIVNFLNSELRTLPEFVVPEALLFVSEVFKTGKARDANKKIFEFLPKLLQIVSARESVVIRDGVQTRKITGEEFKDYVISRIGRNNWHPAFVTHLASVFRDIPLLAQQESLVIANIIKQFDGTKVDDLPPLIHQLLQFSKKGHKREILKGISDHFARLDGEIPSGQPRTQRSAVDAAKIASIEGTVMLHVCYAVKFDESFGNELLKFLKAGGRANLNSFAVSCVLSLGRICPFEDKVMSVMKSFILTSFKDAERLSKSAWICDDFGWEAIDVASIMMRIVGKTIYGWDNAVQTLVQLGCNLVELAGKSSAFGRGDQLSPVKKEFERTPMDRAAHLGACILLELFKIHASVRGGILEQISSRVISKAASVLHFLDLLSLLTSSCLQNVRDSVTKIKNLFEFLADLNASVARALIQAIWPLIEIDSSVRDSLMTVLRKATLKGLEGRKVAVTGFIELLLRLPASSDEGDEYGWRMLSLEIVAILRRCFSQQPEVRMMLYEGIMSVIPERIDLCLPFIEILHPQLEKFYERTTFISAPLRLEACLATQGGDANAQQIVEPIPYLLSCLTHTLNAVERVQQRYAVAACRTAMESIVSRILKADLEDFELDKSADYALSNPLGLRNQMLASLLLGVYEACMEYIVIAHPSSAEASEMILKLFKKHAALKDLLREKAGCARGRKPGPVVVETSLFKLDTVIAICEQTIAEGGAERQTHSAVLRADSGFCKYITAIALLRLQKFEPESRSVDQWYPLLETLGRISVVGSLAIARQIEDHPTHQAASKEKAPCLALLVECFIGALKAVSIFAPEKLERFLDSSIPPVEEEVFPVVKKGLGRHLLGFQRIARRFHRLFPREASAFMQVSPIVIPHLDPKTSECREIVACLSSALIDLCRTTETTDSTLAKAAILTMLSLSKGTDQKEVSVDLAEDIKGVVGTHAVHDDGPEEYEPSFGIVAVETVPAVFGSLVSYVDATLDELEWCVVQVAALLKTDSLPGNVTAKIPRHEARICARLTICVRVLVELEQVMVPKSNSESLLKVLVKTYKVLQAFTKFKAAAGDKPAGAFVELVRITGQHLAPNLYLLLSWLQTLDKADDGERTKKRKGSGKRIAAQAKTMKELRMMPNLIYILEQYERHVIQLAKRSKVDLTQYLKRSTTRDFRIQADQIQDASMSEEEDGEEDESLRKDVEAGPENESGSENEEMPLRRPSKRTRGPIK